jgi:hypothetical protein
MSKKEQAMEGEFGEEAPKSGQKMETKWQHENATAKIKLKEKRYGTKNNYCKLW